MNEAISLQEISCLLEEFVSYIKSAYYNYYAGRAESIAVTPIFSSYNKLFNYKTASYLREMMDKGDHEYKRRVRRLFRGIIGGLMDYAAKEIIDEMFTYETKATIIFEKEEIPFQHINNILAIERDRSLREFFFVASNPIREKLSSLKRKQLERSEEVIQYFGYRSFTELFEEIAEISLEETSKEIERVFKRIQQIYHQAMEKVCNLILDIPFSDIKEYDIPYLLKGELYNSIFLPEKLNDVFISTLKGLGIDPLNSKNITLDNEIRSGKSVKAYTIAIKIPEKIIITFAPVEGFQSYSSLLHESGHALFLANINSKLPYEFKGIGDSGLGEGFALLVESLLYEQRWWNLYMDIMPPPSYNIYAATIRLFKFLETAGKLQGDILLFNKSENAQERYIETMKRFTGMDYSQDKVFYDCGLFYGANYIRACLFAAQLKSYLKEKYSMQWFHNCPSAISFLQELWSLGNKYNIDEIMEKLGYKGFNVNYLVNELSESLSKLL